MNTSPVQGYLNWAEINFLTKVKSTKIEINTTFREVIAKRDFCSKKFETKNCHHSKTILIALMVNALHLIDKCVVDEIFNYTVHNFTS